MGNNNTSTPPDPKDTTDMALNLNNLARKPQGKTLPNSHPKYGYDLRTNSIK